jgi:hypothetical protein
MKTYSVSVLVDAENEVEARSMVKARIGTLGFTLNAYVWGKKPFKFWRSFFFGK